MLLVDHPRGSGKHDTDGAEKEAEAPENPAAGEQRDGRDDQRNLEEDFAKVKAVSLAVRQPELLLKFPGLGFEFLLFVAIAFGFCANLLLEFGGPFGVLGRDHSGQAGD